MSISGASGHGSVADSHSLVEQIRHYWNTRIHDLEMAKSPTGSAAFFEELDAYRYEKLNYLPHSVDFGGYRGRRVLEIGCGIGTDLVRFARGGALVTGVDVSQAAIDLARRNFECAGLPAELRVADGCWLPYAGGHFDLVYCHGVLQYAADPGGMVREAHRVLARKGTAIFMVYNRRSWLAWMSRNLGVQLEHSDAPAFQLFTIAEFDALLAIFPRRQIVPERFPVRSRLHGGLKGALYNRAFVQAFQLLPRDWVRRFGWHLMAFCSKE